MASTFFKGRQMIPALNLIGTRAACVGNHDLDFGMENLAACVRESDFPWLLANITLARDGEHLCGAVPTAVIHHDGVKVGIVGLAEEEWIDTLSAVSPEDLRYEDFVACGRRLATELERRMRGGPRPHAHARAERRAPRSRGARVRRRPRRPRPSLRDARGGAARRPRVESRDRVSLAGCRRRSRFPPAAVAPSRVGRRSRSPPTSPSTRT